MRTYKNLGCASLRSGFVRVHGDVKVCCAFLGSRVQGVRAGFHKAFLCKAACQHYGVLTFKGSSWQQHQGHAQLRLPLWSGAHSIWVSVLGIGLGNCMCMFPGIASSPPK